MNGGVNGPERLKGTKVASSTVHLQGGKAIMDPPPPRKKEDGCVDKLLYRALKGEHDPFCFGSVSTTKRAFNPLKKA